MQVHLVAVEVGVVRGADALVEPVVKVIKLFTLVTALRQGKLECLRFRVMASLLKISLKLT
jgi:hypothetical protein